MTTHRWKWFIAWFLIGALWALCILGALTIGIFVLPIAIVATVLLATRRGASEGVPGLISGLGLPLFYVAFLNRDGPGMVCTGNPAVGQSCTDEGNPWVWLALGLALVAGGAIAFVVSTRPKVRTQPLPGTGGAITD